MTIAEIKEKILELSKELEKYKSALSALQEICNHKWVHQGHSHNDDYYICEVCGKDKWV